MEDRTTAKNLAVRAGLDVDDLLRVLRRTDPESNVRAIDLAERIEQLGAAIADELRQVPVAAVRPDGP